MDVTFGTYRELIERSRSFESLAVMRPWQPPLTGAAEPERARWPMRERELLSRARRAAGARTRLPGIRRSAQRPFVCIISDGLWRRRFGGDPTIVGRQIAARGHSGHRHRRHAARVRECPESRRRKSGRPLQYDTALPLNGREWGHHLRMVGRVARDIASGSGETGARHDRRHDAGRVPQAGLGTPRCGLHRRTAAGRPHADRQAGAVRRPRRGRSAAHDRVRERDEPPARARRRAPRANSRCAAALGASAAAADPPAAHRELLLARLGGGLGIVLALSRPCDAVDRTESARLAAGGRHRSRWPGTRVRPRP